MRNDYLGVLKRAIGIKITVWAICLSMGYSPKYDMAECGFAFVGILRGSPYRMLWIARLWKVAIEVHVLPAAPRPEEEAR
jgi:hypothetical protein